MAERGAAPKAKVSSKFVDRRTAIVEQLDAEHPEFVHVFRKGTVTKSELDLTGQELVTEATYSEKGDSSKKISWRNDLVARMPKKEKMRMRDEHSEEAASDVESLYNRNSGNEEWKDNSVGRRIAKAKKPEDIKLEGG